MKRTIIVIVALILIFTGGLYLYHRASSISTSSGFNPGTYDNFGIAFHYPAEWGIPVESFSGNGLGSISFDQGTSTSVLFSVFTGQDTDLQGAPLNETFDQMIARFKANDRYIYDTHPVSAAGITGVELFYKSAVSGQPYHVEAYFPSGNGSYISFGADYASVTQGTFDSILATLKWDSATIPTNDPTTGLMIYDNNGIRFEYPNGLNTDYASLTIGTAIKQAATAGLNSDGCPPSINGSGQPSPSTVLYANGVKLCSTTSSDVGAGQLYTTYTSTAVRGGYAYEVDYGVHTSNGCGAYQSSPDLTSPQNQKYNECMAFAGNFDTLVTTPIQESISTFKFVK